MSLCASKHFFFRCSCSLVGREDSSRGCGEESSTVNENISKTYASRDDESMGDYNMPVLLL